MGFFSKIRDSWMGGGSKSKAKKGMREQIKMIREAIGEQDALKVEQGNLLQPIIDRGQPFLESTANASTLSGFDGRLGNIMDSNTFGALRDERLDSLNMGMSQRGLNRSGAAMEEIADLDIETALGLEGLLYGREQDQSNVSLGALQSLLGSNLEIANNKSSLLGNIGQVENQGRINQGNAGLATVQNEIQAYNSAMDTAGMFMGSDPKLKKNIRKIGELGPFNWYKWDWKEGAKGPSEGVMADEVKATHPELVEDVGGFMVVNYGELQERYGAR